MLLPKPALVWAGHLKWLKYEAFADIVWQEGLCLGLRFDHSIRDECLEETFAFNESLRRDTTGRLRKLAFAWVHGPGDW